MACLKGEQLKIRKSKKSPLGVPIAIGIGVKSLFGAGSLFTIKGILNFGNYSSVNILYQSNIYIE
jgi:hypothetical protein